VPMWEFYEALEDFGMTCFMNLPMPAVAKAWGLSVGQCRKG